jgi:N6-adenosine-specific RNA methylase IME4
MKFHPLADVFPMIEGEDFDDLVADIKANGLVDAITLYEGAILDGRNRFRACEQLGIEPTFETYEGDPLSFVISTNIERRHLTYGQKAMIGARLTRIKNVETGRNYRLTHVEAAKRVHSQERAIRSAVKIIENGRPALIRAVDQGLDLNAAVEITCLPNADQDMLAILPAADIVESLERLKRDTRREAFFKSTGALAFEEGKWSVFLADPPWLDEFGASARAIENHYETMKTDQIVNLDVQSIAAEHAVLYLWALPHMLPQALDVMKAWGFSYRTHCIWSKDRIGLGKWFRNEHELLLVGRRGAWPPPVEELRVGSVIEAPVGEHSAKPEVFIEMIERWYPDAPKIELFRRGKAREGWSAWGNGVERETAAE